ncbi:MAG: ATP-dependent DNA helicase RecG [Saccharofermentanales bacterium]
MSDRSVPAWLAEPTTILPGISTKRQQLFSKLGVDVVGDLLWLVPRRYEDWSTPIPIKSLEVDRVQTFAATVDQVPALTRRGRRSFLRVRLSDDTGTVYATWFNQPWVADHLQRGDRLLFRGKIERRGRRLTVANPDHRTMDEAASLPPYLPIYPLTAGLHQINVRRAVRHILDRPDFYVEECLPADVRAEHRLAAADYAFRRIHFPESERDIAVARRRLAFEELFLVMAGLRALKAGRIEHHGPKMTVDDPIRARLERQIARLPFELTGSQRATLDAVLEDFQRTTPANRLIQGDVGSGKTVVAALAMAVAGWQDYQSVLMAPTTILARQHAESLSHLLDGSGLEIACLTGATSASARRPMLEALADGTIDILVGTHAVLEDDIVFRNLGLCVTDEQHRFGVRQRLTLSGRGDTVPHVMVMSATPIPRTLAMILYGDLDISDMRDMPKGRQPVKTYRARESDRARVDRLMRREVERGHKVFVVCPMIDDDGELDLRSAESEYRRLADTVFPDRAVALMHGRLKPREKVRIMDAFSAGAIDVLVSTTVIEVGIDQPLATLLVVENAERFGLSQLHQLRGRVGRSSLESFCVLMSDADDPLIIRRLKALCRHASGFDIAEQDLLLRGPGDFFGTEQHGLPDFKVANLYEDSELLKEAAGAADRLFREDPHLTRPEHAAIVRHFQARYGERLAHPGL